MKVGRKPKSGQVFRFRPEKETLDILNQFPKGEKTKFVEQAILEKFENDKHKEDFVVKVIEGMKE